MIKTYEEYYKEKIENQKKLIIDGKDDNLKIEDLKGLLDKHKNLKHLEINNTFIKNIDFLKDLNNIKDLILMNNHELENINFSNLNCENLYIVNNTKLKTFNKSKINTNYLHISECKIFDNDFQNVNFKNLRIENSGIIEDLTFLKNKNVKKITFNKQKIKSLYGIQFSNDTKLEYFNVNNSVDDNYYIEYHKIFVDKNKWSNIPIKDYWKEIVNHWIGPDGVTTFEELTKDNEIEEVIIKGIKLPEEEYIRLFTPDQIRIIKSYKTINKFNL